MHVGGGLSFIAIVERNTKSVAALTEAVELLGFKALPFSNIDSALDTLENPKVYKRVHGIIAGHFIGKISGIELLSRLKNHKCLWNTPFLMTVQRFGNGRTLFNFPVDNVIAMPSSPEAIAAEIYLTLFDELTTPVTL